MRNQRKSRDYEAELRLRIAQRYGIDRPEHVNLDKAAEFELEYLSSPEAQINDFLDKLDAERRKRGE